MLRKTRSFVLCKAECQQVAHIVERGSNWRTCAPAGECHAATAVRDLGRHLTPALQKSSERLPALQQVLIWSNKIRIQLLIIVISRHVLNNCDLVDTPLFC